MTNRFVYPACPDPVWTLNLGDIPPIFCVPGKMFRQFPEILMVPFADHARPRVYAMAPGCDFVADFVQGLRNRHAGQPPEAMARTLIYVNTRHTRTGILSEFARLPPGLLPVLRLVADLANDPAYPDIPGPVSPLRRKLELSQAVATLLQHDQRFAARSATFELADSLARLLDELHEEGVDPDRLKELDLSEHSEHWARSLEFIDILERHWGLNATPDLHSRQRLVVERLVETWQERPPDHPVIVAGSTGSRGATQLLMKAVAGLPQGAVVMPCFDFDLPPAAWDSMTGSETGEDHPQFRIKCFLDQVGLAAGDVRRWQETDDADHPRRQLVSLALRPAPVTDQWMTEGPLLASIRKATDQLTLLEAPGPREEAVAIALRLRMAVENGEKASLVTPDWDLARQVTAALRRWKLIPNNSLDESLLETIPGRFLHGLAAMLGRKPEPVPLVALLKHPLCHSSAQIDLHRQMTSRLEDAIRMREPGQGLESVFDGFRSRIGGDDQASEWVAWLGQVLAEISQVTEGELCQLAESHLGLATILILGSQAEEGGFPAVSEAEKAVVELFEELREVSDATGQLASEDYLHLFRSVCVGRSANPEPYLVHRQISIRSSIDARMHCPDLVIAGGLNEGIWPRQQMPDPWLNRDMRKQAGLLMPERRIGLLAHDFQQVISARNVILSRSVRNQDRPAVPSRWLSRLVGLLGGLGDEGKAALGDMRHRGEVLLDQVRQMEAPATPLIPASRPAPCPPQHARPRQLSVTEIRTLVTDPYQIYARRVLGLEELRPIGAQPEAAVRGTLFHDVMHKLFKNAGTRQEIPTAGRLRDTARQILSGIEYPEHTRQLWISELDNMAEEFLLMEVRRRTKGSPQFLEHRGRIELLDGQFTLTARADRIDCLDGELALYDYKSGTIPTAANIRQFDKQIPLTAKMLELGGFEGIPAGPVRYAAYLRIGRKVSEDEVDRGATGPVAKIANEDGFDKDWEKFQELITWMLEEDTPFTSRAFMGGDEYGGAYHHLARFGEWDFTTDSGGDVDVA